MDKQSGHSSNTSHLPPHPLFEGWELKLQAAAAETHGLAARTNTGKPWSMGKPASHVRRLPFPSLDLAQWLAAGSPSGTSARWLGRGGGGGPAGSRRPRSNHFPFSSTRPLLTSFPGPCEVFWEGALAERAKMVSRELAHRPSSALFSPSSLHSLPAPLM